MLEKKARITMATLLRNVAIERQENIKRAFANGRASLDALSKEGQVAQPYSNTQFLALIRSVNELVGLVEP